MLDPVPAMLEGLTAVVIDAAEEGSPNAALYAVEGASAVKWCDVGAGPGHASVSLEHDGCDVGELLKLLSGKSGLWVSRLPRSFTMPVELG